MGQHKQEIMTHHDPPWPIMTHQHRLINGHGQWLSPQPSRPRGTRASKRNPKSSWERHSIFWRPLVSGGTKRISRNWCLKSFICISICKWFLNEKNISTGEMYVPIFPDHHLLFHLYFAIHGTRWHIAIPKTIETKSSPDQLLVMKLLTSRHPWDSHHELGRHHHSAVNGCGDIPGHGQRSWEW